MNNPSEKQEDILQYELEALKEVQKKFIENEEPNLNPARVTLAILTLAVLGNLFVHFLYPARAIFPL